MVKKGSSNVYDGRHRTHVSELLHRCHVTQHFLGLYSRRASGGNLLSGISLVLAGLQGLHLLNGQAFLYRLACSPLRLALTYAMCALLCRTPGQVRMVLWEDAHHSARRLRSQVTPGLAPDCWCRCLWQHGLCMDWRACGVHCVLSNFVARDSSPST
jgi:hypothetical protein